VYDLGLTLTDKAFKEDQTLLEMLGMNYVTKDNSYVLNVLDSFMFELIGCIITFLLLKYYLDQSDKKKRGDKYHYMHNTLYLKQFVKIQQLFFFFLVADSFFSPTFIQLIVFLMVLTVLSLWALDKNSDKAKSVTSKTSKVLINLQLASLAILQLTPVLTWIKTIPVLKTVLLSIGLIVDTTSDNVPTTMELLHVFFLCCSITTGQFYTRAKLNFRVLPDSV